jgi:antitoxin HicB
MDTAELLKKPYARMVLPDTDGTFTAEIVEFPGCIASGRTPAEALATLEEVAVDWVAAALEQGQEIPEPVDAAGYSGKLVVRMAKGVHKRAALWAEREGVSLNQFIVNCVAEQIGMRARPLIVAQTQPFQASFHIDIFGGYPSAVPIAEWGMPRHLVTSGGSNVVNLPINALRERADARS